MMDSSVISALAALAGAVIGGLTSVTMSWLSQDMEQKAQAYAHNRGRREELYKEFIEEASKTYIAALQHTDTDVTSMVGLYATISRMRVLSSAPVIEHADKIAKTIVDTYMSPNKSLPSCEKCCLMARSTCFGISAKPAAKNGVRDLKDSETT